MPRALARGMLTRVGIRVEKRRPVKKMKLQALLSTEKRPIFEKTIMPAYLAELTKP
jgi:hypothetical protein